MAAFVFLGLGAPCPPARALPGEAPADALSSPVAAEAA